MSSAIPQAEFFLLPETEIILFQTDCRETIFTGFEIAPWSHFDGGSGGIDGEGDE